MSPRLSALAGVLLASLPMLLWAAPGPAQERLPWQRTDPAYRQGEDAYAEPREESADPGRYGRREAYPADRSADPYAPRYAPPAREEPYPRRYGQGYDRPRDDAYRPPRADDAYSPPPREPGYGHRSSPYGQPYTSPPGQAYSPPPAYGRPYGEPYTPPREAYNDRAHGPGPEEEVPDSSYSSSEILQAGHNFFGSVSKGLASVVEYVFQKQGRPNGYILGQEAGGAFVAGLRYGEGMLYTKDAGYHRVYWQGPSIGYDAGAEGSKVMMLVYNLRDPEDIYRRFGGIDGSAYLVGGVGVTFQTADGIVVAPIRAGVGLRLGANIGYLKYTRRPTWNPF